MNKNIILIFCDDISYFGSQLCAHLSPTEMGVSVIQLQQSMEMPLQPRQLNKRITYFLNLVGVLQDAFRNINKEITRNVVIPKSTIKFLDENTKVSNILDKLENYRMNDCIILTIDNNEIKLTSMLDTYFTNSETKITSSSLDTIKNLSLVYPFHKYPDAQSTFGNLCRIKGIKKIINIEKFCNNNASLIKNIKINEFPAKLSELWKQLNYDDSTTKIMDKLIKNWDDITKDDDLKWICISSEVNTSTAPQLINGTDGNYYIKTIHSDIITANETCYKKSINNFYKRGYNYKTYNYLPESLPLNFYEFFSMYAPFTGGYSIKYKLNKYKLNELENKV